MSRYPLLFSPIRLGPVVLRNRIVFSAHLTNFATEDGLPSPQHAAYYAARAAGGAGLVITEEHSTHPTDWPYEKLIHGFRPEVVTGYRAMTEAVHRWSTPVFAQINHNGGQGSGMYSRLPLLAPSAVADPLFREVPKAMDAADIADVLAGYAIVAGHCRDGGFDGIELQCSHSSLVRQFLSPATNLRGDRYGGTLANRARLLLEVVAAVRETVGRELAVGVRLCGDELIEGGITLPEAVEVAKMVERQGLVDYLNTSIGVATATLFAIEASMHTPPGYALFIPSAMREAVRLPVVGVGRLKDPAQAERALAQGACDLVGVVRGQIADPDFAAKARAGEADDIRLCLSCNQECVGRMGLNRTLGCIESPGTGREATPPPRPAARPGPPRRKRVLVVGGGPAGLQAAISAARGGHAVVVVEQADAIGGQVRLAAAVPNRAELGDLIRNQQRECARLGVAVRLRSAIEEGSPELDAADVVIVATGSRPDRPAWAPDPGLPGGPEGPKVADVRDVLEGTAQPGGRVLVVDELGFHQATSVAELLADRGCAVEVVTSGMVVGQDLGATLDLEGWNMRARAKHIVQTTDRIVTGLEGAAVGLLFHPIGRPEERLVDWVVLCVPPVPNEELYFSLRRAGRDVHRVGDAVAPRRANMAVLEGETIGSSL